MKEWREDADYMRREVRLPLGASLLRQPLRVLTATAVAAAAVVAAADGGGGGGVCLLATGTLLGGKSRQMSPS